jgi:hypothetical protein
LMVSQVEMQLEIYRCTNSVGRSTVVVSLKQYVHDCAAKLSL